MADQKEKCLYVALAKMYLWQAAETNEPLPDDLANEVRELLGEKMVDAIIFSEKNATFDDIAKEASK